MKTQLSFRRKTYMLLLAGATAYVALFPLVAKSQLSYPDKPIKWVVPFPAGGGLDAISRVVAQETAPRLKQPILVDNRTGAGGTIGTAFVAQSSPDGYTIMSIDNGSFTTAQHFYTLIPYSPPRDLRVVATLVRLPVVLVTGVNHVAKTYAEFDAFARSRPGKINYGSVGAGNPLMVGMELLQQRTNLKFQHVPYRAMTGVLTDLSTGEIDAALVDFGSARPFIDSGKIRILAVATEQRLPLAPNAPTFDELGVKNLPISLWHSVAVPAKTPDAIVEKLAQAIQEAMLSPAVKSQMDSSGAQMFFKSGKVAADYWRDQVAFWEPIVKPMNIKLD